MAQAWDSPAVHTTRSTIVCFMWFGEPKSDAVSRCAPGPNGFVGGTSFLRALQQQQQPHAPSQEHRLPPPPRHAGSGHIGPRRVCDESNRSSRFHEDVLGQRVGVRSVDGRTDRLTSPTPARWASSRRAEPATTAAAATAPIGRPRAVAAAASPHEPEVCGLCSWFLLLGCSRGRRAGGLRRRGVSVRGSPDLIAPSLLLGEGCLAATGVLGLLPGPRRRQQPLLLLHPRLRWLVPMASGTEWHSTTRKDKVGKGLRGDAQGGECGG